MEHLGRYEILGELGRGAMGTVYRARDPKIDRVVALKTINLAGINPAEEEAFRQRFVREAQAAGKLSHPSIVTIYDVGEEETSKTPYIVMEFIEGQTLEDLARGERLPIQSSLTLVEQVAEALAYAHDRQIIHRDIKPANIIVTPDGRAKITDFGIAKLQTTQFTQPGQVLGTPAYMSPEQVTGGAVDGRTDLFSLGCILYWLLTGEKPFAAESTTAATFKIVYQDPIPPSRLNPGLSADHDYLIQRALAKDPARRYQNGHEFARDVADVNQGRPPRSRAAQALASAGEPTVVAQPPIPARAPTTTLTMAPADAIRTAPPERRRRWLAAGAFLAAVLLLVGVGGWWWAASSGPEADGSQAAAQQATPGPASTSPARSQEGSRPKDEKGEPPPHAPAVGKRSQTRVADASTRKVAKATLRLTGSHNLYRPTLYVYADGKTLRRTRLHTTGSGGKISLSLPIPAGQHTISVRLQAPRDDFDQIRYVDGTFRPGQTRTLEITMGKLGKWIGIGELTRELTLRWLD